MDIQTKKLQLIEQLTRVEDDTILEQIREVLSAQVPLGFDELGNPINQSALKQRVQEAESRIATGDFLTQAQVEEEAGRW